MNDLLPNTKICEICGNAFTKKAVHSRTYWETKARFCSHACHSASMRGKQTAPRMPCRICGEPTRYYACDRVLADAIRCNRPECVEASKLLKNQRIGAALKGRNVGKKDGWRGIPLVSIEEVLLNDWFASIGWEPQHRVNTGVHTVKLPRMFRLDFALPVRKLYVEIDGSSHRSRARQERDALRDSMLTEQGWVGIRIPAKLVRDDIDAVKRTILDWTENI